MRLDRLKIGCFKNLQDFEIDFDQSSFTTALVGRNGTGKSNLLEALTIIFRDLDLRRTTPFSYELDYVCRDRAIHVVWDPEGKGSDPVITAAGQPITASRLTQPDGKEYLPQYVFGYYSGPSNRMEEHFEDHQNRFYDALLKGDQRPLRPFFYARPVHSQFVLLSFFMEQDKEALEFMYKILGIEAFDSALFVMWQPPWKSREGDDRFWNARGTVQHFLDQLYERSLAPLRMNRSVRESFRKYTTAEHLYLYIQDADTLRELAQSYSGQQDFFKALESTYISELVSEVRIRVKVRDARGMLTFRDLSEGEQQLLMVLGLLRFTRESESLFLLDEPDTHLNPAWNVQYFEWLRKYTGAALNSHVIVATHDPLMIAGLLKEQVQIMQRDETTGRISAQIPDQDPRGMGVSGLLTSEVYGLRSQLDTVTMEKLDRRAALLSKSDRRTDDETAEMQRLTDELGKLGFATSFDDPLYTRFVRAIAAHEEFKKPVLTKEDIARQEVIAQQVLEEILLEEIEAEQERASDDPGGESA